MLILAGIGNESMLTNNADPAPLVTQYPNAYSSSGFDMLSVLVSRLLVGLDFAHADVSEDASCGQKKARDQHWPCGHVLCFRGL